MLLVVAATEIEMNALRGPCPHEPEESGHLITGVGLLETAVTLTRFLDRHYKRISAVVNFGVGGGYLMGTGKDPELLDICLAKREVIGDFGVCFGTSTEPFPPTVPVGERIFELDEGLRERAAASLSARRLLYRCGTFVTVNGASGTAKRGDALRRRFGAICENMEGAAVARVCVEFDLPMLEIRALSNLVEDRPGAPWKLEHACVRAAEAVSIIIEALQEVG